MNRRRKHRKGFTLIEVLLVLAILVILGGMVGLYFTRIQGNAYSDAAKTQMGMFAEYLKIYRLDAGTYPDSLEVLVKDPGDGKWRGPYLEADELPKDPWGKDYTYEKIDNETFEISSPGPNGNPGDDDDVKISNRRS